jgi:hypothetical protein
VPRCGLPVSTSTNAANGENNVTQTHQPEKQALPMEPREIHALLERSQKGDKTALPALRELLQSPRYVDMLGGDLAYQAQRSFVEAAAGDNLVLQEALTRKLELLRNELAGPSPTPVEKLLVERVVACWLQVHDADIRYAQARDLSIRWAEYYQCRMDRAHRRYLSALKTLATVRRLALSVLIGQVNIAARQKNTVNVANPGANAGPNQEAH